MKLENLGSIIDIWSFSEELWRKHMLIKQFHAQTASILRFINCAQLSRHLDIQTRY